MDSALKRSATPGFLLIALSFFILPGASMFYVTLVTGYAHGAQGFYGGYKSGRFKLWQLALGALAIYPLINMPLMLLILTAAAMSITHFVTDEFFLFKRPVTTLTRVLFPGFLFLLIGTLFVFFQYAERNVIFSLSFISMILPLAFFWKKVRSPSAPEIGTLILIPTVFLALAFSEHERLAMVVHLMGMMHFWSWYVEYYRKSKERGQRVNYLTQCLLFLSIAAVLGYCGWYLQIPLAQQIIDARIYFAWIIVHSILSFRPQDIAQWIPARTAQVALERSA